MNRAAAMQRFEAHCPPYTDPSLTLAQIATALSEAVTADVDGNEPSSADWTPTYSPEGVWRAIARGWEMKASNAVGRFDFTTDGQQFRRSQIVAHCHAKAAEARRKLATSVTMDAG